ncbi:hypothetical protein INR49_000004 [Caranx melampygus]|nr:hypothetical protein INR49_000004 [Caranx melampygus]
MGAGCSLVAGRLSSNGMEAHWRHPVSGFLGASVNHGDQFVQHTPSWPTNTGVSPVFLYSQRAQRAAQGGRGRLSTGTYETDIILQR